MLVEDLQNYHQQFQSIRIDAQDLLTDLTDIEFNWQPGEGRWSISQCIDHLVVTGRDSLSNIHIAIKEARSKGSLSQGPLRYRIIETWFVRLMDAPPRVRFKAPKAYTPPAFGCCNQRATNFYALQDEFLKCIEVAHGVDLSKVRVSNAVSRLFRLSLGQEIAFNAAHERRHLWQARQVRLRCRSKICGS
jgi:DinB superfamily